MYEISRASGKLFNKVYWLQKRFILTQNTVLDSKSVKSLFEGVCLGRTSTLVVVFPIQLV